MTVPVRTSALIVLAVVAAIVLAACGSDDESRPPATAAEPATRVWENPDGSRVRIPADPRRVVLIDPTRALTAIARTSAAGRVVGTTTRPLADGERTDAPEGWTDVGPPSAPRTTAVAGLEPDLIVSRPGNPANARLADFAPVAQIGAIDSDDWRRGSAVAGDVLGVAEDVSVRIMAAELRIRELRRRLAPATTVSVLEIRRGGIVARPGAHPTGLLEELGLTQPERIRTAPAGGGCCVRVTLDELDKADADYVLVAVDRDDGAQARRAKIEDDRRWRSLGAHQRDDLHLVDPDAWTVATLPGVETALGDVEGYIVEAQGG